MSEIERKARLLLEQLLQPQFFERDARAGFNTGFGACMMAGAVEAIERDEVSEWLGRFSDSSGVQLQKISAGMGIEVGMAMASTGDAPVPEPVPPFTGLMYRRTVCGPADEQGFEGGTLRVTSLDVFDDGTIVRWLLGTPMAEDADLPAGPRGERGLPGIFRGRLEMTDDVGTVYQRDGHSYNGPQSLVRGATEFRPGIPEEAGWLRLQADDAEFFIELAP